MMMLQWGPFGALVERWREEDKTAKIVEWHTRLSADQAARFSQNLFSLAAAAAGSERVVTAFDLLPLATRQVLVELLRRCWSRFPVPVVAALARHVAMVREVPELRRMAEEEETETRLRKKRRSQERDVVVSDEAERDVEEKEEEEANEDDGERYRERRRRSPSLSLSAHEEEDSEEREGVIAVEEAVEEEQPAKETLPNEEIELLRSSLYSAARSKEYSQSQRPFCFTPDQCRILNRPELAPQIGAALADAIDEAIELFFVTCGCGVDAAVGTRGFAALLQSVLLPRVLQLSKTASRSLLSCCRDCAKSNSRSFISNLLVPVLLQNPAPSQCELVTRVMDDLSGDDLASSQFVTSFLDEGKKNSAEAVAWSDGTLTVLQKLLSSVIMTESDCAAFLAQMHTQAVTHHANVKFAKLLLAFATKFGATLKLATAELARTVASQITSFLSKTILQKLG